MSIEALLPRAEESREGIARIAVRAPDGKRKSILSALIVASGERTGEGLDEGSGDAHELSGLILGG